MTFRLSLPTAILVNLNIMLGTGVFINTCFLSSTLKAAGGLAYAAIGLAMLPLVLVFSRFLSIAKAGTFYDLGTHVHPSVGFFNGWLYFTGKLASAALGLHFFTQMLHASFPALNQIPLVCTDWLLLVLFALLVTRNVKTGIATHYVFILGKCIPLGVVIFTALLYLNTDISSLWHVPWQNVPKTIPIIFFAFSGFEASCSISQHIERPQVNAPKAVLISYAATIALLVAFQSCAFGILPTHSCGAHATFIQALPDFIAAYLPHIVHLPMHAILVACVALSALGAAYGIIYSNMWNIFTLAQQRHVWGAPHLERLNACGIPVACVALSCAIVGGYVWLFSTHFVWLQHISSLSLSLCYLVTSYAFVHTMWGKNRAHIVLGCAGLASCILLLWGAVRSAQAYGYTAYLLYGCLIALGCAMYVTTYAQSLKTGKHAPNDG